MDISGASSSQVALTGVQNAGDPKRAQLQMMLLKRALEDQKRQAAEMQRLIEGKGTVIDLRV